MTVYEKRVVLDTIQTLMNETVGAERYAYFTAMKALAALPETEVTQCWECGEYDRENGMCAFWDQYRHPDHFCGEGVIKKEAAH